MDFLLEVGCEEIPARFITPVLSEMGVRFQKALIDNRLSADDPPVIETFGTPRRLVLSAKALPDRQSDLDEELLGPRVEAAFDAEGKPTKACQGFARSKGVEVDQLLRIQGAKGEVVGIRRRIEGQSTEGVLGPLVEGMLAKLSFPKTMRWGDGKHLFARPVHWLLALLDDKMVELEFAGIRSGRKSRGHRFSHPQSFEVKAPLDYFEHLKKCDVLLDPKARKSLVVEQAHRLAKEAGGLLVEDQGLESEVSLLTEFPVPLLGRFDETFIQLPRQVLIAAMRNHQRYFSIAAPSGELINAFVAVGNTPVEDPDVVRHGNERVLSARLSDAKFFYETDQKTSPAELLPELQDMLFQADLGSYYDKAIRIAELAVSLAHDVGFGSMSSIPRVIEAVSVKVEQLSSDDERVSWQTARAALLAKTDLLSEMVGEFPELQGEMGGDYTRLAGESELVSLAIRDHYHPRFAGDTPPETQAGAVLSIVDRIDTMAGCFGVGLRPTGTADPYALRRLCLGVITIVLDRGWRVSLRELLTRAVALVSDKVEAALLRNARDKARKAAKRKKKEPVLPDSVPDFESQLVDDLLKYFQGRLRTRLADGVAQDVVDAVLAAGMEDMAEAKLRVDALAAFALQPAFQDLAVAFKRVVNIIKGFECAELDPGLFEHDEERELFSVYTAITPEFDALVDASRFDEAMELLGGKLRGPVDRFFEKVLVNDPDNPARQANRKALLNGISMLFGRIADFSKLQTKHED
jgi:glycyl-tRNA synthetase beta chain